MESGVEVRHRSLQQRAHKYQDPQRCFSMQQLREALPSWEQLRSEIWIEGNLVPESTGARQAGASKATAGYCEQARACRLWGETVVDEGTSGAQSQVCAATAHKWDRDGDVHMGAARQHASSGTANAQEPSLFFL